MSRIPEINYAGSLQTTALMRQQLNGESEWVVQQTGTTGFESYIWQPWLVRTRGRLSVAYDQTGGADETQSMSGSGEATFAVLPLSKYPVTFDFAHVDSRVEGDFAGSDYTRDRAAVNARAAFTQTLRAGLRASYDRVNRSSDGDLSSLAAGFDITKTFGQDEGFYGLRSVGFLAEYQDTAFTAGSNDPTDEDGSGRTALAQFTLQGAPMDDVTFNSVSSYVYDDEDSDDAKFSRNTIQSVSTLQWRPDEHPYIVTGTFRALAEQVAHDDTSADSDSNIFLLAGTGGFSWPVNNNLSVTGGLSASYENSDSEAGAVSDERPLAAGSSFNFSGLVGYSYYSDSYDFSGFDWRWDSRGAVDAGMRTEEGFVTSDTLAVGHRLERTFNDFFLAPLRFSVGEDVELRFNTDQDEPFGVALNHSLGLTYSSARSGSSSLAQIFLRDSRDVIGDDEFQMAQGRVSQRWAFDRDKSLQAEFSGQLMRQVSEKEDEKFITVTANAVYADREFLGVEGLDFNSEMRLNVLGLNDLFGTRESEFAEEFLRNDWRNVLRYRIGRLTLSTEATAFHTDKDLGYLFLVRLRRDFGGAG